MRQQRRWKPAIVMTNHPRAGGGAAGASDAKYQAERRRSRDGRRFNPHAGHRGDRERFPPVRLSRPSGTDPWRCLYPFRLRRRGYPGTYGGRSCVSQDRSLSAARLPCPTMKSRSRKGMWLLGVRPLRLADSAHASPGGGPTACG